LINVSPQQARPAVSLVATTASWLRAIAAIWASIVAIGDPS
jgi:hypothetical protein